MQADLACVLHTGHTDTVQKCNIQKNTGILEDGCNFKRNFGYAKTTAYTNKAALSLTKAASFLCVRGTTAFFSFPW
jgi:hypothetical protein